MEEFWPSQKRIYFADTDFVSIFSSESTLPRNQVADTVILSSADTSPTRSLHTDNVGSPMVRVRGEESRTGLFRFYDDAALFGSSQK